jgi:hypothetical protein
MVTLALLTQELRSALTTLTELENATRRRLYVRLYFRLNYQFDQFTR